MNVHEMRILLSITQKEFAKRYNIPYRTIQNWESGVRTPPEYVSYLLEVQVRRDLVNHKTSVLPKYDPNKLNLPKTSNYMNEIEWLQAVRKCVGEDIVFALDEALMCHQYFLGRTDEFIVWVYGLDSTTRFNGIVVLGNEIDERDVVNKNGLRYTNLNRTVTDSLANESILDMQGITEALSMYYFENNESFDGIYVPPEYQARFNELARDAMEYYNS